MQEKPDRRNTAGTESKTDRKARLAAELRANLLKRKAQSRQRQDEQREENGGKDRK